MREYIRGEWKGRGGRTPRLHRKQPPLDDETGALFVYLPGSGGEVLATLDEALNPPPPITPRQVHQ